MSNYEIFDSFFDHQVKWMYGGIEATMTKQETLHACALALSTYTEIMGGLVTGNLKESSSSGKNYNAFLHYLGQKYVDLDNLIRTHYPKKLRSLYGAVRSKLVHEFSLREQYGIFTYEKLHDDRIGIEFIINKTKIAEAIHINFYIPEYYRDFKNAITKYYSELKNWEKNPAILDNFLKATVNHYSNT